MCWGCQARAPVAVLLLVGEVGTAIALLVGACGEQRPQASSPTPAAESPPSPATPTAGGPDPTAVAPLDRATAAVAPAVVPTPRVAPGTCHARGPLPDPACTPGQANPAQTAATLCAAGFSTRSIRPPARYTDQLKAQQMVEYGRSGSTADYEEDHLIPLELGGEPTDPRNLWPQPREHPGAAEKDRLENTLHRDVCAGATSLADAQRGLMVDWLAAYRQRERAGGLAPDASDSDD